MTRRFLDPGVVWSLLLCSLLGVSGACLPPREGFWGLDAYEPPLTFASCTFRGTLALKRHPKLDNVFLGKIKLSQTPVQKVFASAKLHVRFDPDACTLYGTVLFPYTSAHDAIVWTVQNDVEINGVFQTALAAERYFYATQSMDIVRYYGPEIPDAL